MILFAGDCHGEFRQIAEAVVQTAPEAVILLGDLELRRPLHEELASVMHRAEVWWIPGNHEFEDEASYDRVFDSSLSHRNLHGQVVEVGGYRIAGLGGVFHRKIWDPKHPGGSTPRFSKRTDYLAQMGKGNAWRGGLPLRRRGAIWKEDLDMLACQRADILVTHEAPSCHPLGYVAIDELAESMGVQLIVHGHHHETYRKAFSGGVVQGVGQATVVDLDGQRVAWA